MNKTIIVPGISCAHCVATIEREVADLDGVISVKADEASKQVTIEWGDPAKWQSINDLLVEIEYPPAEA